MSPKELDVKFIIILSFNSQFIPAYHALGRLAAASRQASLPARLLDNKGGLRLEAESTYTLTVLK